MKASPWQLVVAHYRTLRDRRTDESRWQDYVLFLLFPALVYAGFCVLRVRLPEGAAAGLLTAAGVLSAFFFGVMLAVAQRSLDWADTRPPRGKDTAWQADFLTEIAANAGYAGLVSIAVAAVLVSVLVTSGEAAVLLSCLALALSLHLALMLGMVLARIYAITANRLVKAKADGPTGTVTPLRDRDAV